MIGMSSASADCLRSIRARWQLPRLLLLAVGLALGVAYVGSYGHLSRRGMREAERYGMKGFLYISVKEACEKKDLSRHHALAVLYTPLNWVDRTLLGAAGPGCGFTWGLSK